MRLALILCAALSISACVNTGKKEYPKLEQVSARAAVVPLWVAKVGEKSERQHRQLSVAVTGERVYAASQAGKIMALRQSDGQVLWTNAIMDSISSGPVVDSNLLYVGTIDAHVFALNADSGDIVWQGDVSSEVLANPVISENLVFIQTIDGKLAALDKNTGEKIWTDAREVPALTLRGTSSPVIVNDKVIAGFANGKLVALQKATGKKLWESVVGLPGGRTDLQRMVDIDGLLQADNDEVYAVTYQGRIAAVSVENGRTIWTRDMSSYNGIVMDYTQLYITDVNGYVWALDRRSGATIWRQGALQDRDVSNPVIVNNALAVADGAGFVHWLAKEDGGFIARNDLMQIYNQAYHNWGDEDRQELDFGVSGALEAVNDRLYVRNNMGALSVFQVSTPVK
ncbi:MAG: outer membrane protein assembly factor BamB [Gammaproteobacteria bacterium]|nr:outer membrane protein assembly factor BamB [Gammaproteobacteria bacterium]